MEERRVIVGRRNFLCVDITDPCYDKDVWCRINNKEVLPGEYECAYYRANFPWEYDGETHDDYRITRSVITHTDYLAYKGEWREIGVIGVDAGLAGFFESKPDYSNDKWHTFCDRIGRNEAIILEEGFCTRSGFGDGGYPVCARIKDGNIVAMMIEFIEEDETV